MMSDSNESSVDTTIKVLLRIRPPTSPSPLPLSSTIPSPPLPSSHATGTICDISNGNLNISDDRTIGVKLDYNTKDFYFSKVFDTSCEQKEIFNNVIDAVNSSIDGYNASILSYGQTNSGKTYTMEGSFTSSLLSNNASNRIESLGIIPRTIDHIYDMINMYKSKDDDVDYEIIVSYYEIYCEKCKDLLNPDVNDNMKIRENKHGWYMKELTEVSCQTKEDVYSVLEKGCYNRKTSSTFMNADSSRSHRIFTISIIKSNKTSNLSRKSTLFLVDLAGSEKVGKTGAVGIRLEEAKNINKSLSTLGQVISSLCDNICTHIPYRDSKLTCLLKECLGGNSKTILIICISPEVIHLPETISTLRFGERARKVKLTVKLNEETAHKQAVKQLGAFATASVGIEIVNKKVDTVSRVGSCNGSSINKNIGDCLSDIKHILDREIVGIDKDVSKRVAVLLTQYIIEVVENVHISRPTSAADTNASGNIMVTNAAIASKNNVLDVLTSIPDAIVDSTYYFGNSISSLFYTSDELR